MTRKEFEKINQCNMREECPVCNTKRTGRNIICINCSSYYYFYMDHICITKDIAINSNFKYCQLVYNSHHHKLLIYTQSMLPMSEISMDFNNAKPYFINSSMIEKLILLK